jgi:hypothetical protein
MRKSASKLKLGRETLRRLTENKLRSLAAAGGFEAYSALDTNCNGCDMSPLCGPTYWVGCETQ